MDQPANAGIDRLNARPCPQTPLLVPCLSSVITASRRIDSLHRLPLFAAWTGSTAIRYVNHCHTTELKFQTRCILSMSLTRSLHASPQARRSCCSVGMSCAVAWTASCGKSRDGAFREKDLHVLCATRCEIASQCRRLSCGDRQQRGSNQSVTV
jgi:hypothetical protein